MLHRPSPRAFAVWITSSLLLALLTGSLGCSNDPYPGEDRDRKILYRSFAEAPKTLDPAVAYTTSAHAITGNIYEGLLEYHYLDRPYRLIPALSTQVPEAETDASGRIHYRFTLRPGI